MVCKLSYFVFYINMVKCPIFFVSKTIISILLVSLPPKHRCRHEYCVSATSSSWDITFYCIKFAFVAILAAILNSEVCTSGIPGDFWYFICRYILNLFWKQISLLRILFTSNPNALGLFTRKKNRTEGDPALHLSQVSGHLNWLMGLPALLVGNLVCWIF